MVNVNLCWTRPIPTMAWREKGKEQARPAWMVDDSSSSLPATTSSKSRLEAFNALNAKFQNKFTSSVSSSVPSSSSSSFSSSIESETSRQRKSRFSSASEEGSGSQTGFVPGVAGLYIPPKRSRTENTADSSSGSNSYSDYDRGKDKFLSDGPSKEDIQDTGGLYFPGPEEPVVAGCALPPPEPSDPMSKSYLSMYKHKSRVNAIRFTKTGDYAMTCSDGK